MNGIDEIRAKYIDWEDIRSSRFNACVRLVFRISQGFRHFIGAPEFYEQFSLVHEDKRKEKYVVLASVSLLDADNLYHFEEVDNPHAALVHERDEGVLTFGIGLVVDRAPNAFPKLKLWFRFSIRFEGGVCRIWLYRKEAISIEEAAVEGSPNTAFDPLFSLMLEFAKDAFSRDPWERPRQGGPWGFLATPS